MAAFRAGIQQHLGSCIDASLVETQCQATNRDDKQRERLIKAPAWWDTEAGETRQNTTSSSETSEMPGDNTVQGELPNTAHCCQVPA